MGKSRKQRQRAKPVLHQLHRDEAPKQRRRQYPEGAMEEAVREFLSPETDICKLN